MHFYTTTLCDNNDTFKEITKDRGPEEGFYVNRGDADGKACIYLNGHWFPHKSVEKLSAAHQKMTFTAMVSDYDDPNASQDYFYEFKAGDGKLVNVDANYFWPVLNVIDYLQEAAPESMGVLDEETVNRLTYKITEVFKRVDVTIGEGKGKHVNFYDGEVSVNAEDGNWKMKATKVARIFLTLKYIEKWSQMAG